MDDYNAMMSNAASGGMVDVARNALFGQQQLQQNENALAQQQMQMDEAKRQQAIAIERQQQQKAMWGKVSADPSPQNVFTYMAAFPEISDGVKKAYDVLQPAQQQAELRTMTDVAAALHNGKGDVAKQILTDRETADKAAGIDTSHYAQLASLIDSDPTHSRGLANLALASVMGPDKFSEAFKELGQGVKTNATLPADIATAEASAKKAGIEADYAKPKLESDLASAAAERQRLADQTANDRVQANIAAGRLELDKDTLASNIQLKLTELNQTGTKPDEGSLKIMNDSAVSAVEAASLADKENDLAERIRQAGLSAGPGASAAELIKRATGNQNIYTQLRAEWNQIKNKQALSMRKDMPGAMSDADRNFLLQGFPPDNASPEYLSHFLTTMAKAQSAVAAMENRKASWVASNGNLGTAKRDIDVGGTLVPAGTTFAEFMGSAAKASKQGGMPAGLTSIINKYGGKK